MNFVLRLIAMLVAIAVPKWSLGLSAAHAGDRDDIIRLPSGDPEMAAAIGQARAALDAFLAMAADPPATISNFSLKVGLPVTENDTEFVWVRPFRLEGTDFVGRLVNTPRDFPGLSFGQQIVFDRANIIDFAYREGDRLKGHFTTCVLLKRMPASQRAAVLAENPIVCPR